MPYYPYRYFHLTWFHLDPEGWWSGRALFHDGEFHEDGPRRRPLGHTHTVFFQLGKTEVIEERQLALTHTGDVPPEMLEELYATIQESYALVPEMMKSAQDAISASDCFMVHQLIRLRFKIAELESHGKQLHPATIALTHDYDQLEAALYDRVPELQGA